MERGVYNGSMSQGLKGKTILITRPRHQAGPLIKKLKALGARPVAVPVIRLKPLKDCRPLDRAVRNLDSYSWLFFTSANAVACFRKRLDKISPNAPLPKSLRTYAIGVKTALAMRRNGIPVTKTAGEFRAESMALGLGRIGGKKILLPRALEAREILPATLRKRGAKVDVIPVYETVQDPRSRKRLRAAVLKSKTDILTFTSSSTVKAFMSAFSPSERRKIASKTLTASIGPITSKTLRGYGFTPRIQAKPYTAEGLVREIRIKLGKNRGKKP